MKKIIYLLLIPVLIIVFFSACTEETTEPEGASDARLLDPATGWEHVITIPYEKDAAAQAGNDWMTAYDMTEIDGKIGILYSANYYLPEKGPVRQFFKNSFNENDSEASGTKIDVLAEATRNTFHSQLIPNTLIPVFINFAGTDMVELYDENDTKMAMFLTNTAEEINYQYLPDGNFLGAGLDNTYASHFWNLQYPATQFSIPDIKAAKNRSGFQTKIVMPLKLSDGAYYTVSVGTVGATTNFQLLKLLPEKDYNIEINYEIIKEAELTGIPSTSLGSPSQSLIAYRLEDDVFTFVLADFAPASPNKINKLHTYRWNKNGNSFTTLWESEEVNLNFSKGILSNPRVEYRYRENRLTREGTFYTLFTKEKYGEPDVGTQYTILYTVDGAGIHELGRLDELYSNSVVITTCRYMKGSYYALVYPWGDSMLKKGDAKFHLEVVKLNP